MTYAVVVVLDAIGWSAMILRDDSPPLVGSPGVRFRLVCQTDDHAEAVRVAELLERQRKADSVPPIDWGALEASCDERLAIDR